MITIDADDPTPPFEQIRAALAAEITSGRLAGGHRLPTVRQIAGDLHVAVGTAARAYRELEEAGLVETRRSQGTLVRHDQIEAFDLDQATSELVRTIPRDQVDLADVLKAVETAWNLANSD
ncbi:GntR family transcriptional regulator [Cryobacterium sp. 5B3]|uniref:GntR family transcriptional regulator n=1 Tax=Cryobacterium sp. 5B3 TaxID=3048586 RepID=UPI002AB541EB|nr:GntR family transcriptional regulator [Cryobacterium sp. 5B3]MDY7541818.1 GntR family transcriptional regulator [Cryobacterium sp. 5B3]MEB0276359.1 GntR family transcriptional regulator [Cryobacterium sp. 5B3]